MLRTRGVAIDVALSDGPKKETLPCHRRRRHGRSRRRRYLAPFRHACGGLRASAALCTHRRRRPDDAQLDEGSARNWRRAAIAPGILRSALASQPGLGYRRGHARAPHAGEPLRGAVFVHASWRSPRCAPVGATSRDHPSRQEARWHRAGWRRRGPDIRRRQPRACGCRSRSRRSPLGGARHRQWPRRPCSQRPHRLSGGLSVVPDEWQGYWSISHQVVGHRSPYRHLLHERRTQ